MASPVPGLPPLPWTVAEEDPPDTEVVAEFPGEWEPRRECVFYGGADPQQIFSRPAVRDSALQVRRFHNVVLAPHHVIISYADGRVLPVSYALGHFLSCLEPGIEDALAPQTYNPWHCKTGPARLEEPVFLAQPGWPEYGHALVEAAPKLDMLSAAPKDIPVLTSGLSFQPMFEAFGVNDDRVRFFSGPLFCRTVYIPDPPVDLTGNFHTRARAAYDRLSGFVGSESIERNRRIFVSRSRIRARRLSNEAAIEALFTSYGFEIVHPEMLSVYEQIRMFASAEMVAGLGGSAMHSLVFASPETKVLILSSASWLSDIDQYIAKRDGQYGYVIGSATPTEGLIHRQWPWTVDADIVDYAIREHFGP